MKSSCRNELAEYLISRVDVEYHTKVLPDYYSRPFYSSLKIRNWAKSAWLYVWNNKRTVIDLSLIGLGAWDIWESSKTFGDTEADDRKREQSDKRRRASVGISTALEATSQLLPEADKRWSGLNLVKAMDNERSVVVNAIRAKYSQSTTDYPISAVYSDVNHYWRISRFKAGKPSM